MIKNKKNIFFDFIDTIVQFPDANTKKNWLKNNFPKYNLPNDPYLIHGFAYAYLAYDLEVNPSELREYLLLEPMNSFDELLQKVKQKYNKNFINDEVVNFTLKYIEFLMENCKWIEGAQKVLNYYKDKNLYLVTNIMYPYNKLIYESDINCYFSEVFLSNEISRRKPDFIMMDYIMKKVGAKLKDSIFIGDNWCSDVVGALNVGMDAIFINKESSSIGNYLLEFGLKGLLEIDREGKISIRKEYQKILEENLPKNSFNDIDNILIKEIYKDDKNIIKPLTIKDVVKITNISEIIRGV